MPVSRRQFLALSSAAAAVSVVPFRGLALAQAPPAPAVTELEAIRRNVGYFTGRGGVIGWLSHKEGLLVVDTQFPDTAKICLERLREQAGRVPDVVINTHHHGDHTGGNGVFKGVAKKIVAQARVPELQKRAAAQQTQPNAQAPVLPDETFDSAWSVALAGEKITARHFGPAHTSGDAIVHFEAAQVVHLGDLLFHQMHPYVDRQAGASMHNWLTTIEAITKQMPADTIYIAGHSKPGHAVTVGRKEVLQQRDYFDAVLSLARKGIAAGHSRDTVTSATSLAGFNDYHSAPPRLTLSSALAVAYDELTAK